MRQMRQSARSVVRPPAQRVGSIAVLVLVGAATLPGVGAAAEGPLAGACFEADSLALDATAWGDVLEATIVAADGEPDFFPAPVIASVPDLTQPWAPGDVPTIRIGVWARDHDRPASDIDPDDLLAEADCVVEGATWSTTIPHALLMAGAERILAGARVPDESGEPPIREDAEAAIYVEFDPTEERVRTTLEFNVSIGPFGAGGTCWIDDVLSVDVETGTAISTATDGRDVPWLVESGCRKFQAFMTDGGAGERALTLLPAEVLLGDGTIARFVADSIEVHDDAIVMSGAIDHGRHDPQPSESGPAHG